MHLGRELYVYLTFVPHLLSGEIISAHKVPILAIHGIISHRQLRQSHFSPKTKLVRRLSQNYQIPHALANTVHCVVLEVVATVEPPPCARPTAQVPDPPH